MATGYTHDVADGKVTDFNEFALRCSCAMGVAIMMREEPSGPIDIDKCADDSSIKYHKKALKKANKKAKKAQKTDAEILAGYDDYVSNGIKMAEASIAEARKKRKRYDDMLKKVEKWKPPTEEHINFKKFMREQLRNSIDHDCNEKYSHETIDTLNSLTRERYLELSREERRDDVKYHTEGLAKAKKNNESRRAWITALLESLGELETA